MQQDCAPETPFGAQSATCQHWMGMAVVPASSAALVQPAALAAQKSGAKPPPAMGPPRQQVPRPADARQSSAPPSAPTEQVRSPAGFWCNVGTDPHPASVLASGMDPLLLLPPLLLPVLLPMPPLLLLLPPPLP